MVYNYNKQRLALTMHSKGIIFYLTLLILIAYVKGDDCALRDSLRGCTNCTNGSTQVLNISSNKFECVQVPNCEIINSDSKCTKCISGFIINILSNSSNQCVTSNQTGCKTLSNGACTQCISSNYVLNSSNICQLIIYDYCWKADITGCTQCSDQNIISASNCSISSLVCSEFDYQKWYCSACPLGYVRHQSSIFCYNATDRANCLVISVSGCIQCNFGYYINVTSNTCYQDTTFALQFQLLPMAYYLDKTSTNIRICLDNNLAFNTSQIRCASLNSTFSYCRTSNSTSCVTCIQSYYLSTNGCLPCSSTYSQCLLCDSYNCKQCEPNYFLVIQSNTYNLTQILVQNGVTASVTQCMPCTIYGCKYCRSEFDSRGIFSVRCDYCLFGFKLYNHTCIKCPSGQLYNLSSKVCDPCKITNCMYCNSDEFSCEQCVGTMYYDLSTQKCIQINLSSSNQTLTESNAYEILNKSLTLSSTSIINDEKLLMTNCAGSSNGFACLCANSTSTFTSLCYPINTSLLNQAINFNSFSLISNNYSTSYLKRNASFLLLLSELPNYNWIYAPLSTQLISNQQFANYLQITTNYIRNHPQDISSSISSVSQLVFNRIYKTFNPYYSTIFSGPGYYFKYTPASPKLNDTTVVSLSSNSQQSVIFIYFNSIIDSTVPRITGTSYVFLNQAPTQLNLKLKKISFLGNNENYIVISNGNKLNLGVSSDSQGYVTISGITTSDSSTFNSYFVSSTSSGSTSSASFSNQRIENLIYKVAFIYILIFLTLYLTLIPFCALVDCVDNKSLKRKIKSQQDGTYQGIKQRSGSQLEEQVALKINYKDFFPIYNIANTERPRRLLKLCLFLVNSQHSITFLTLIYFNLSGGQSLVAVLLAIPAYLCTIILGYLCGLFTLHIPGKFKYLINLVTLGYWILWVPLMSNFRSFEYAPYVFTFAIIFFCIDMLIDFLETLLMYFTIKQQSRQIKLFKALSKWLSYRGYYEFDKMAKKIDEIRDNTG